ncbi:MAG: Hsp20 family protein [Verrucomicrobia bacterium]|nr:Hsp20 family protein [Cytophagales bacterium]
MKNIAKDLVIQADFMNTVGGGMSLPEIRVNKEEGGYMLEAKIPGVSAENLRIDVINQRLLVYYNLQLFNNQSVVEKEVKVPYMIANFPVPDDADINQIAAIYRNDRLQIIAPLSDSSNGFNRSIEIEF